MLDSFPRLRDTLSRGFLIGGEIGNAKSAKVGKGEVDYGWGLPPLCSERIKITQMAMYNP